MKKITAIPKKRFDKIMAREGWSDTNLPSNLAFISICCLPEIKKNYLEDYKHKTDEHWFRENHPNVLNLDFDDVKFDKVETAWGMAYGMTDDDATKIAEFAKQNADKDEIVIHCMAGRSRSVAVALALSEHFKCKMVCFFGINGINDFVYNKLKGKL